ncbi:DUF6430 domain-containing protein (plasmid) [Clostridium beijerinckii]|uniref:macro domain-containing protein n=1 Tax=Clostridium beijerinckii TaxID=1520 RepID=UPI002226AA58|nr:macro domain-containing protein [Clostridium beijerinckii]UYZ39083.1 DUF6430 domain-containing protein [Clostridium beijerinckii]
MFIILRKRSIWVANCKFSSAVVAFFSTFVPEKYISTVKLIPKELIEKYALSKDYSDNVNIILIRICIFLLIIIVVTIIRTIYLIFRRVYIKGNNYIIQIQYGNLVKMHNCKKVIAFDECFTTVIGEGTWQIKPHSICGQYLAANQLNEEKIRELIKNARVTSLDSRSKYNNMVRYKSGKLVPNGDDLLLAFAKLNERGLGELTYDEFLDALSTLWQEIDAYYAGKDVCISILGSGCTRIEGKSLTQQQLLDIIIASYRLSSHKIKLPYQLHIVCKRQDNFSLNKIGENI